MPFWSSGGRILLSSTGKGLLCDECPCDPPPPLPPGEPPLPPGEIVEGCLAESNLYCNDLFPNPVYLDLGAEWGIRIQANNFSSVPCDTCDGSPAEEINDWLNGRIIGLYSGGFCLSNYSKEFTYDWPHWRVPSGENVLVQDRISFRFSSLAASVLPERAAYPNAGWYAGITFSNVNRPLTPGRAATFNLLYGIENCDWNPWPKTLTLMSASCQYGGYTYTHAVCKNSSTYPDSIEAIFVEP